jgi:hypothetical protein
MFKVLTVSRNTSVVTSHQGFPDAFQLTWSVPDGIKCSYDGFPQLANFIFNSYQWSVKTQRG